MAGYIAWQGGRNYFETNNYLAFYSQWRPSVLIYTISLASILFYFFKKIKTDYPIIKLLANLSFFVFFIHVYVMETIWKLVGNNLAQSTHTQIAQQIWYDPVFFILISGTSFLIAYLVHKIPYLEKLSG